MKQTLGLSGQNLYSWQTKNQLSSPTSAAPKMRQPSGASAPQPSQSGIQNPYATPKGVSNTMGNPKFGGDMGIYGPTGSQNRQAADQFYGSYQGPTISKGPYVPSATPGKAMPMQQDWMKGYKKRGQSLWEGGDNPWDQRKVAELNEEQERAWTNGTMTPGEFAAISGRPAPMQQMQGGYGNSMTDYYGSMARGGANIPANPIMPRQPNQQMPSSSMQDLYRPKEGHPDDIVRYHDIARADGKLQGVTRDGRTVLVDPPARDQTPVFEGKGAAWNQSPTPPDTIMKHYTAEDGSLYGVTLDGRHVPVNDYPGKPMPQANPTQQSTTTQQPNSFALASGEAADQPMPMQDFDTSAYQMNPEATRQDTNSAMNAPGHSAQDWDSLKKAVPQSAFNRFVENYNSGKTQMSPADAALYYQAKYAAPAIGAGAVQGLQQQGQAKIDAANQYYQDARNLKDVGRPDYADKNYKTQIANDRVGANNKSMEDQLAHQRSGGGLQANNTTLSNLYGSPIQKEVGSRDAAILNADADRMKSQREEYNAEQDRQFANWRSDQNALYNRQQAPTGSNPDALGLKDGKQASMDIAGLNGQFNAIMKNGQSKGLKFKDFVQNKIDNGELKLGDDVVKIVEKNYGPLSEPSKERALSFVNTWGDPTTAMRDVVAQRREAKQKISDEGMARRAQIAAQQGNDRMQVANLIGRGYSPAQANAAVAQHNDIANYYGMANNMANAELQSRERIAEGRNEVDRYQTDQMMKDRADQRKADQAARLYEEQRQEATRNSAIRQSASEKFPGDDLNDPTTPGGQYVEDRMTLANGGTPKNRLAEALSIAPENRTQAHRDVLIRSAKNQMMSDPGRYNIKQNTSVGAITDKAKEMRLNQDDTLRLIGDMYQLNLNVPDEAYQFAEKLSKDLNDVKGTDRYGPLLATYGDAIRALSPKLTDRQKYDLFGTHDATIAKPVKDSTGIDSDKIRKDEEQKRIDNLDKRRREEEEYRRRNPIPHGFNDSSYLGTLN